MSIYYNKAQTIVCALYLLLSSYLKAIFTSGADNGVLALCFGQSEDCLTLLTLSVNVRLSVSVLVSYQLEESAKFLVLTSALGYISRHSSEESQTDESPRKYQIQTVNVRILFNEQENDHIYKQK